MKVCPKSAQTQLAEFPVQYHIEPQLVPAGSPHSSIAPDRPALTSDLVLIITHGYTNSYKSQKLTAHQAKLLRFVTVINTRRYRGFRWAERLRLDLTNL